ncbi:hypothetical protein Vafri_588, partial [Volvox africanus]
EDDVQPAESESEAASAPADVWETYFAPPPPPQVRPRQPATPASAAGVSTSATSEQSICLPPSASLGKGEVTEGVMLHDRRLSGLAAAPAGASAGSGGVDVIGPVTFMQPPSSSAPYRVDSTLTLAVQRGPAAMDWEADGQNEVRGPEHIAAPGAGPAATGGGGGGGGLHGGVSRGSRGAHPHDSPQGGKQQHAGVPAPSAATAEKNRPGGAGGGASGAGGAATSGLPTLSTKLRGGGAGGGGAGHSNGNNAAGSPRHANIHPFVTAIPEPS